MGEGMQCHRNEKGATCGRDHPRKSHRRDIWRHLRSLHSIKGLGGEGCSRQWMSRVWHTIYRQSGANERMRWPLLRRQDVLGMTVARVSIAFKCPEELVYYLKGKEVDFYVRKLSELYIVWVHVGRKWEEWRPVDKPRLMPLLLYTQVTNSTDRQSSGCRVHLGFIWDIKPMNQVPHLRLLGKWP